MHPFMVSALLPCHVSIVAVASLMGFFADALRVQIPDGALCISLSTIVFQHPAGDCTC